MARPGTAKLCIDLVALSSSERCRPALPRFRAEVRQRLLTRNARAMPFRQRIASMARVLLGLYLIGNVTYRSSQSICQEVLHLNPIHEPLVASLLTSFLDVLVAFVIFRPALLTRITGGPDWRKSALLGVFVGAGIVASMLLGSAFGLLRWSSHSINSLQWIYLIGFSTHAAISEELLCRFLVLDRLGLVIGRVASFLLQILLFVYLHMFGPPLDLRAASHLAFGAVLIGSFYLWSGSLLGAMALHLTYDVLVSLTFGGSLDGLAIRPFVVGDNFSLLHSHQASALFMSGLSIWLLWNARRRAQAPPDTTTRQ
ncbi:hypothetical protein CDL60_11670 [Roseateles noduli]|nr:hypothetical protein CDL60_11670 [Roseateles noduli]